jgi:hypothetical protein
MLTDEETDPGSMDPFLRLRLLYHGVWLAAKAVRHPFRAARRLRKILDTAAKSAPVSS